MEIDMLETTKGTIIKVVGVGGAGGNAVQHMINKGVSGVEFIVANTDAQALSQSKAHNVIQVGESGLGAGMKPAVGRQLAEETRDRIEDATKVMAEGDTVEAMIINVDRKTRAIALSIKAKDSAETAESLQKMAAENAGTAGTTSLGALLRAKLDDQQTKE